MKLRTVIRRATRKRAKRGWRKVARRPLFSCGSCGKSYSSPLGHVCGNKGDFGKRRRAKQRADRAEAAKAKRAAARKRASERVAAARKAEQGRAAARVSATRKRERARAEARVARARASGARAARRPASKHDYRNCRDHDCERAICEAYREGLADAEERQ